MKPAHSKQHAVERWAQEVHRDTSDRRPSPAAATGAGALRGGEPQTQPPKKDASTVQAMRRAMVRPIRPKTAAGDADHLSPPACILAPTEHCLIVSPQHGRGQKRLRSPSPLLLPPQRSRLPEGAPTDHPVATKMRLDKGHRAAQPQAPAEPDPVSLLLQAAKYLELADAAWLAADAEVEQLPDMPKAR